MSVKRLHGAVKERSKTFSFDSETARSIQEAGRYQNTRDWLRFISALAAFACFIAEMRCFSNFIDWLPEHLWTDSHTMQVILAVSSFLTAAFLVLFGILGVCSLYSRNEKLSKIRTPFILVSVALVLPPMVMGDSPYLRLIVILALCILLCSWLAGWAGHQRPHDWKIILAEKERLNWGPLEFATALTKGRASDGHLLAFVSSDSAAGPRTSEDSADSVKYERLTTILTLTLKHRYPWSSVTENWQMLIALLGAAGCTDEERERLGQTWLYVHPEIEERVNDLIGPRKDRGFGPGVFEF